MVGRCQRGGVEEPLVGSSQKGSTRECEVAALDGGGVLWRPVNGRNLRS